MWMYRASQRIHSPRCWPKVEVITPSKLSLLLDRATSSLFPFCHSFYSSTPPLRSLTLSCASSDNRSFPSKSFLDDFLAVGNANENLSHLVPDDSSIFSSARFARLSGGPPKIFNRKEQTAPARTTSLSFCSYRRPSLVNLRGISVYCLTSSPA